MQTYLVIYLGFLVLPVMATLYVRQMKTLNANPIDLAWTILLALGILIAVALNLNSQSIWPAVAVALWSIRLSLHLWKRQKVFFAFSDNGEDPRYSDLRRTLNPVAFWKVYFFQSIILAFMTIPIFELLSRLHYSRGVSGTYAFIWAMGALFFEAVSDWQLSRFKKNKKNRGKICKVGFWAHSRHPNYFFEWLFWFWPVFLAKSTSEIILSLIPALIMFSTLNFLTGVKVTEAHMLSKYGENYEQYQKESWSFFPKFFGRKTNE